MKKRKLKKRIECLEEENAELWEEFKTISRRLLELELKPYLETKKTKLPDLVD